MLTDLEKKTSRRFVECGATHTHSNYDSEDEEENGAKLDHPVSYTQITSAQMRNENMRASSFFPWVRNISPLYNLATFTTATASKPSTNGWFEEGRCTKLTRSDRHLSEF